MEIERDPPGAVLVQAKPPKLGGVRREKANPPPCPHTHHHHKTQPPPTTLPTCLSLLFHQCKIGWGGVWGQNVWHAAWGGVVWWW